MSKVYLFLAEGCEEIEALTPVDLLRRAGEEVVTVSITDQKAVTGSHKITMLADALLSEVDLTDADLLVLPGGMPGTLNLNACQPLMEQVKKQNAAEKKIAAICAAPGILGNLDLVNGREVVCFPGHEPKMKGAVVRSVPTVTDGHITTGRGMGAAIDFSLQLIAVLQGQEAAAEMAGKIVYPYWK